MARRTAHKATRETRLERLQYEVIRAENQRLRRENARLRRELQKRLVDEEQTADEIEEMTAKRLERKAAKTRSIPGCPVCSLTPISVSVLGAVTWHYCQKCKWRQKAA